MTDHDDAVAPALFSPEGIEPFARLLATRIEHEKARDMRYPQDMVLVA